MSSSERTPPIEGPISAIPSLAEMQNMVRLARWMRAGLRITKPLKLLGVDLSKLEDTANEVLKVAPEIARLVEHADRFNAALSGRGWIAYGTLDHELITRATNLAEAGDPAGAESLLVAYYDRKTFEFLLMRASTLAAMEHRTRLIKLAYEDHLAGRYHASIPVVLAQLYGLVADLSPTRDGLFSKGVDVLAWDSVEGHPTGLSQLAALMRSRRMKTRGEPIELPFRHGILHGRDCGYDSELVSAKSFAAFFAAIEWAKKVERGERLPVEKSVPTLRELAESSRQLREDRRWLELWTPRTVRLGQDIPASGQPEEYSNESPERVLAEFLHAWRRRNYGAMGELVSPGRQQRPASTRAGLVRGVYEALCLRDFVLVGVDDATPCYCDIRAACTFLDRPNATLEFRVAYLSPDGEVQMRSRNTGSWWVGNWAGAVAPVAQEDFGAR
jgi:hypothetical protein